MECDESHQLDKGTDKPCEISQLVQLGILAVGNGISNKVAHGKPGTVGLSGTRGDSEAGVC